jgi:hypothetical protein
MMLIPEWKTAYRFLSVQANVIGMAMATGYATMYPQLKDTIPPDVMAWITGAVFVLGIVARVISQQRGGQ